MPITDSQKNSGSLTVESDSGFKQIVRGIGKLGQTNIEMNVWSVGEIDEYVRQWIALGYKVTSTHYLGEWDDAFFVLYILAK